MQAATLREMYDLKADAYDALVKRSCYVGPQWVSAQIARLDVKLGRVLDLACANGIMGQLFHDALGPLDLLGVDFSGGLLQACKSKKIYRKLVQHDLNLGLPMEIKHEVFDLVLATGCLEFISNHEGFFQQIHSVLAPEGLFWFTLQERNSAVSEMALDTRIKSYTEDEAHQLIKKCGFKVLSFQKSIGYKGELISQDVPYFLITAKKVAEFYLV